MKRSFQSLSDIEVMAVAIDVERNNAGRFQALADTYIDYNEELYRFFKSMAEEEVEHEEVLEKMWKEKFADESKPDIGENDIEDVIEAVDMEHGEHLLFDDVKLQDAMQMVYKAETTARKFYQLAAQSATDKNLKKLYEQLAELENGHVDNIELLKFAKLKG
jgi:rubrerythrin